MIYPNVEIGEGTVIEDGAIIGKPPRGAAPGELPTRIGKGGIVRSHTVIYAGSTIGDALNTGHGAVIREDNVLGDACSVGSSAELLPGNRIGSQTRVHAGCVMEFVTLGSRVFLGPHVVFTADPHPPCPRYLECVLGAVVEDDVSIGANSTIFPAVRIGAGSLIAAGSLVSSDISPGVLAAGNPARAIRRITQVECFKGYYTHAYAWREPGGGIPTDAPSPAGVEPGR